MNILSEDDRIIADIINRILNCRKLKNLMIYGEFGNELGSLFPAIKLQIAEDLDDLSGDVGYLCIKNSSEFEKVLPWISKNREKEDFIIYVSKGVRIPRKYNDILGIKHCVERYSNLDGTLFLIGPSFQMPLELVVSDEFKVLAIIHFYNEVDIIEQTIRYLLDQEIDLYLLDNWSDDGSYEIAKKYHDLYSDRIYLEQFPISGKSENYEWYSQLERTEQISKMLDYNWFIHYDMDEMRVSPWEDISLRKAIYWIDKQGYNCIENTVVDFKYTEQDIENIFMKDTYFDFRHDKVCFFQLKTWKKTEWIELKSSGGHWARVAKPKIYPLKILNRHYPLRSIEQAEKKVFHDRLPRFKKEHAERGWHNHYDQLKEIKDVIYQSSDLLFWGKDTFQELYVPLFLECGIKVDEEVSLSNVEPLPFCNKKIIIYGAGNIGKKLYQMEIRRNDIVGWGDKSYGTLPSMFCETFISISDAARMKFDYIIIAIKASSIQQEIRIQMNKLGVPDEKIICVYEFVNERTSNLIERKYVFKKYAER